MGNAHPKEARHGASANHAEASGGALLTGVASTSRHSRNDAPDAPFESRETRQERAARRLEKEKVARIKERERSMAAEHVDGGYLVTMGVYTASEDFSKPVVRQLIIERRIAPFWKGLEDFDDTWAEHQIIAAARGLDVPPADVVPPDLVPDRKGRDSPPGTPSLNMTLSLRPRTLSSASDLERPSYQCPMPSSAIAPPPRTSSPLMKPHKALAAALNISSKNISQQDLVPRETQLPHDPFVNGQALEVYLYKDGIECSICMLYYPKYLNKTRCCDQYICTECFVQIKRPDPHIPEQHGSQENVDQAGNVGPPTLAGVAGVAGEGTGELTMEPACCPFCARPEFGVTYEPPPFRRGCSYEPNVASVASMGAAMSSSSSLTSTNFSPTSASPSPALNGRRRGHSLSANASGVISTDRIRPDWKSKLDTARAHQRRRAAAADALHQAAFIMGNNESTRSLFGRSGRFSRRGGGGNVRRSESPSPSFQANANLQAIAEGPTPGPRISSGHMFPGGERIDASHLESLMMAEAIRLSIADEEDRRRKADKEAKKEAKQKEKEDRKSRKRSVYGPAESTSPAASASSLSVHFALGRKRGNGGAGSQNLRSEPTVASSSSATRRPLPPSSATTSAESSTLPTLCRQKDELEFFESKGKSVDRGATAETGPVSQIAGEGSPPTSPPMPIPSRGSHLRHMSNASSLTSSATDGSVHGSYPNRLAVNSTPHALSFTDGRTQRGGQESMFNFTTLSERVGVSIDGDKEPGRKSAESEHVEHADHRDPTAQRAPPSASPDIAMGIASDAHTRVGQMT